ncbi:hypothetical protein WME75_13395 [Sorangium sp. So ce1014]|uniref:hypothetical protein n=1 Tax=Sorangium sp. So ce1014 TaxID=3133326 RepID=UPI003F63D633
MRGGSTTAAQRGAALALLALLPGCYIDLSGLTGGAAGGAGGAAGGAGGAAGGAGGATGGAGGATGGAGPGEPGRCAPADCDGPCVVAAAEEAGAPAAIAAAGPHVVWTSRAGDRVRRLDPATGAVEDLVSFTPSPGLLAAAGGLVVWVAADGLWRCPADGCAAGATSLLAFAPGEAEAVRGLATDGRHVYWTRDEPSGTAGELLRCPVAEGCGATPELLAPSQSHPRRVAVAPGDAGDVVWVQHGTGAAFGQVLRLDKGAPPGALAAQIAVLLDFPDQIALGDTDVLWTWAHPDGSAAGVSRCDLVEPCAAEPLAPQTEPARPLREPAALVIDGADAYWADRGAGTVLRCPAAGCPGYPEVLAEGLTRPAAVAVQGACVYAVDEADGGRVVRVPR